MIICSPHRKPRSLLTVPRRVAGGPGGGPAGGGKGGGSDGSGCGSSSSEVDVLEEDKEEVEVDECGDPESEPGAA